ncbi:MAG: DUF3365 domain-containing protein [Cyclobacteriaceae bacterium]|nr:DUF3365 domain-containing protein [Cyclobacteriaceae bacterium]
MMRKCCFIVFAVSIVAIYSCNTDKKVDSDAIKKEINNREIVHVTESEILQKAHEIGNTIATNSQQALGAKLKGALGAGGVENAISYCNLQAMPLIDSLSKEYNAQIRRVSLKNRNPADAPSTLELQILEAYESQTADSLTLSTNVQPLGNDQYLFTKPIMIDNALCLACHGTPENGLATATQDLIKSKYPADKAIGYQIGDLRGMWSIVLPKKSIVQAFSAE